MLLLLKRQVYFVSLRQFQLKCKFTLTFNILMLTFLVLAELSTSQVCCLSVCQPDRPKILLVLLVQSQWQLSGKIFHPLSVRENTQQYKQKPEISILTLQNMVLTPGKFCLVREINKNNNSDMNWGNSSRRGSFPRF